MSPLTFFQHMGTKENNDMISYLKNSYCLLDTQIFSEQIYSYTKLKKSMPFSTFKNIYIITVENHCNSNAFFRNELQRNGTYFRT